MASGNKNRGDKLFNPQGFKHYRRTYTIREFWWGLFVLAVLFSTGAWVVYKGAHPDPDLFKDGTALLRQAKKRIRVIERKPHNTSLRQSRQQESTPPPRRIPGEGDRLLPASLAGPGWTKKATSHFSAENLYEKINGRAGYYRSFGCKQLFFTTLIHDKTQKSIDIELYDHGKSENALGAYAGELGAKATPEVGQRGMSHISRNALYLSRGPYYARVIGSDESPTIKRKLLAIKAFFEKQIEGSPLPWAYGLFVAISVKASAISYVRENAFSFGFAKDVYTGKIGANTYLFITAQHSADAAQALSQKFREGWLSYGSSEKGSDGITWVKDRYISTYATATAVERWVIGVQGATDLKEAQQALARLRKAVLNMPPALRRRAKPASRSKPPVRRPVERSYPEKRAKPPQRKPVEEGYNPGPARRKPVKEGYNPGPARRRPVEESNNPGPAPTRARPVVREKPATRPGRPKTRAYEGGVDER